MITRITLRDFKSFAEARVPMTPFTLLVGANASGKSNLFDAIRLLQGLAADFTLTEVLRGRYEGGKEVWQGVRGGAAELARGERNWCSIESEWRVDEQVFKHKIGITTVEHPHVSAERLAATGQGDYLFDTHAPTLGGAAGLASGGAINVGIRASGGGRNISTTYNSSRSLLRQIQTQDRIHPAVIPALRAFSAHVADVRFLSITPSRMRDYAPSQASELGASGENISGVVAQLAKKGPLKHDLVDWLIELCAPELVDIDFVRTDLQDVLLQFVEADGTRVSARSLSDGTLRFLGELVALLTAPEGSVLLMEEIENGLHPGRIDLLVQLYEGLTQERNVQVVATTHSPTLLRALSPRTLGNAVLFARHPDVEGTVTSQLKALPRFDEVLSKRGIDYLFTTKWLERAV